MKISFVISFILFLSLSSSTEVLDPNPLSSTETPFTLSSHSNAETIPTEGPALSVGLLSTTPTSDFSPDTICNQTLLVAYGLQGYSKAKQEKHSFCPKIQRSCCTPADQLAAQVMWNDHDKFIVERHYSTYLYSLKYLLGFVEGVNTLATEFENSQDGDCKNAAVDQLALGMTSSTAAEIFREYEKALEALSTLRKGFYCLLCDALTQDKLKEYWSSGGDYRSDRVYASSVFCKTLVDQTIKASYSTTHYLKRYVENSTTLMGCKIKKPTILNYELSFEAKKQVKNCYYFRDSHFFFFCSGYCQSFNLVRPVPELDGDLGELRKFVSFYIDHREGVFGEGGNSLIKDLKVEEGFLKENYNHPLESEVFFKPKNEKVDLSGFGTTILNFGGIDIWESVEGSLYQYVVEKTDILRIVVLGLFVKVFFK